MDKYQLHHLKASLKKSDMSVMDSIYRDNRLPFLKYASRFEIQEIDVLDVYQDAILALRDNVVNETLETMNCTIRTYLFSIGKFMIFRRYKDSKKLNSILDDTTIETDYLFPYENDTYTDDFQQQIDVHFDTLSETCQEVLKLFYYDGWSLTDIQDHFNYDNYNVVKSQKSRCLKTLKDLINKHQNDG